MPLSHTGATRCAGTTLPMIPKEVAVSILRKAALVGNYFLLSIFESTLEDPPMVEQTHQNQSEQTPPSPPLS